MDDEDFAEDAGDREEDDDDDIARFERQCAERARAEGLLPGDDDDEAGSEDEDQRRRRKVRVAAGHVSPRGGAPGARDAGDRERSRTEVLEERLARRDAELAQVKGDLDMLKNEGVCSNDPAVELKQRLIEMSKKARRLQVANESQRARLHQLEAEVKKPKDAMKREAEELVMQQNNNAMLGEGLEDWKKKYLTASNKLQEARHEAQELRALLQKQRKVLQKELGSDEALEKALAVVDDPADVQWRGRQAQISQLQRQVRELKDQLKAGRADDGDCSVDACETPQRPRAGRADHVAEKERVALTQAAEKRREEFERLQEEAEKLRGEQAEAKRKREALKSRNSLLESQFRELKAHVQLLLRKSDDDDALVVALRRQLGRHGPGEEGGPSEQDGAEAALRQENDELRTQIERQAQIVLQLRQKSLATTVEGGSARLGPKSVEAGVGERQLVERVRFLEAENAKYSEHVRLLRERHGDDQLGASRPFSSESMLDRKDKLRQLDGRFSSKGGVAAAPPQRADEDARLDSSPSCRSSRSSSRGVSTVLGAGGGMLMGMA